jgi:hypothetical protein
VASDDLCLVGDEDPADDAACEWPDCPARGNPYKDNGWCWWPRYYLWLREGFFCPGHTAFLEAGVEAGGFDWRRDTSPEVLDNLAAMTEFATLDSERGQSILRRIEAQAARDAFRTVDGSRDGVLKDDADSLE